MFELEIGRGKKAWVVEFGAQRNCGTMEFEGRLGYGVIGRRRIY